MDGSVLDEHLPDICLRCEHRSLVKYLLHDSNVPFCLMSSNTCARWHGKKSCSCYKFKGNVQLEIHFN